MYFYFHPQSSVFFNVIKIATYSSIYFVILNNNESTNLFFSFYNNINSKKNIYKHLVIKIELFDYLAVFLIFKLDNKQFFFFLLFLKYILDYFQ